MNINLIKLRGLIHEMRLIRIQLTRIADGLEPAPDMSGPPIGKDDPRDAEVSYTDTDLEYVLEMARANNVKIPGVYDPNEEPREK